MVTKHKNLFTLTGLKELDEMLKNIEPKLQNKIVRKALRKAVSPLLRQAKATAPKATGNLKKSIKARIQKRRNGQLVIQVRPFAPHFYLIEVGGDNTRRPTKAKVLAFKNKAGQMVFARQVEAAPAKPFFTRAYNQNKDSMIENFRNDIITQLQKMNLKN